MASAGASNACDGMAGRRHVGDYGGARSRLQHGERVHRDVSPCRGNDAHRISQRCSHPFDFCRRPRSCSTPEYGHTDGGEVALTVAVNINGTLQSVDVDPSTPLLYVLRNDLQLNGAKYGCGLGQCGACTVQLDGKAIFSCLTPVSAIRDRRVRTVEGLGSLEHMSPLQRAFADEQAAQCGYCIAGMIMRAQALLDATPRPDEAQIRRHMQPNLCRCGTHMRILRAVRKAAGLPVDGHSA